jgi:hypothetical protein
VSGRGEPFWQLPKALLYRSLNGVPIFTPLAVLISASRTSNYRLRSGMKTDKGNIVHYFEALKDNSVALTINGDSLSGVDAVSLPTPCSVTSVEEPNQFHG